MTTCTARDQALGARPAGPAIRVVVQQRQRLFREGISQLLAAEADIEVVAMATTADELVLACHDHRPAMVLIEADVSEWDALRLTASLRRSLPHLVVVGLAAPPVTPQEVVRARRGGMAALVSRHAGISGILAAVRAPTDPLSRPRRESAGRAARSLSPPTTLTPRELEVLSLVGAGLTSVAVSCRLHISHKTVENHKQRIFAKLGVQNQAHAVSVAMRTGIMRPDRVISLAVGS